MNSTAHGTPGEPPPTPDSWRAALRAEVAAFNPRDAHEAARHAGVLAWVDSGAELCRRVKPATPPRQTAAREVAEELGIEPPRDLGAPLLVTCSTTVGHTAGHEDVALWYLVRVPRDVPLEWERGEFVAVRWFRLDEVPLERAEPHLGRCLARLKEVVR